MLSSKLKSTLDFALTAEHVYQPGDSIEGSVIFNPPGDVILHDPCITLEGQFTQPFPGLTPHARLIPS